MYVYIVQEWFLDGQGAEDRGICRAVPDYRLIKHMLGALLCITILRANFFNKVWLVLQVFVQFFPTKGWGFNCLPHKF